MWKSDASRSPLDNPDRLVSLDALRGFDMIWILGADALVNSIGKQNHSHVTNTLVDQMTHSPWEGFAFYDLIFPMFIFIAGVSLVFSLSKIISQSGTNGAVKHVLFRSVCLFALGVIYNGGMSKAWPDVRVFGVLQRIALCYLATGLLFTYFQPRTLAIVAVSLLLLYWGLMALVPVPGSGRDDYSIGKNLADYLDKIALPGRRHQKNHEPEGLLSTLPAIVNCLLGVFAGLLLRGGTPPWKKVVILLFAGAAGVALGMAWGGMFPHVAQLDFLSRFRFPVIKKIWTSSFVLVTAGYSAMLLGLFYLIVDVWHLRTWAMPFIWIGMNAITLYLVDALVPFGKIADRLVGGSVAHSFGSYADIAHTAMALLLVILLARFMFRRNVFVKV